MNPIAHTKDPAPSHDAARRVTDNGQRARHAELVFQVVKANPGLTAIELWGRMPADVRAELKEPQEVRRRLTDLFNWRKVSQGPERKCKVRGTSMVVWLPTEKQPTLL